MKKSTKIVLITAAALIVLGIIISSISLKDGANIEVRREDGSTNSVGEMINEAIDKAGSYVMEQIDELHRESETQQARLSELEALTEQSRMLHQEFAFHQEMIESFASAVDSATLEEKRRLLRTIVKKVVWDGKNAYVYLFAEDGEADLPPIDQPMYPLGEDSE